MWSGAVRTSPYVAMIKVKIPLTDPKGPEGEEV
jgi:hypothetical protein